MGASIQRSAGYLAGLIDGEGCVRVRGTRSIEITNTDPDLVDAAVGACEHLGIACSTREEKRRTVTGRPVYRVVVMGRANLERALELVPLQTGKRQRLEQALSTYIERPQPPSRTVLDGLYSRMTLAQVGRHLGVHRSTARLWCIDAGIQLRRRGSRPSGEVVGAAS